MLDESDHQVIIAGHDGVTGHREDGGKPEAFSRDGFKSGQDMLQMDCLHLSVQDSQSG